MVEARIEHGCLAADCGRVRFLGGGAGGALATRAKSVIAGPEAPHSLCQVVDPLEPEFKYAEFILVSHGYLSALREQLHSNVENRPSSSPRHATAKQSREIYQCHPNPNAMQIMLQPSRAS